MSTFGIRSVKTVAISMLDGAIVQLAPSWGEQSILEGRHR